MTTAAHPILSCAETRELEARLFGGEEAKEWPAMQRAGRALADAVLLDYQEIGGFPAQGKLLVLVGKGHNGGDALIAAQRILERFPCARAEVVFVFGERALRPLARRAWQDLAQAARGRINSGTSVLAGNDKTHVRGGGADYDLSLDGVFGFQFRPPVADDVIQLFSHVERLDIRLRAAVDLPSGLSEVTKSGDPVLRADFSYATGCVKAPLVNGLHAERVGRVRYLDLGFFAHPPPEARLRVLTPGVLASLTRWRKPESDKRDYGHVFVLGGSRSYPGAVLMTVLAALRSGAGLVTAFVPESLAASFAARAPEAMWVGWPETPSGALALEGQHLMQARIARASALVAGPGLTCEPETMALVMDVVRTSPVPLVLDADALQPEIVRAGTARRVLTPHLGELQRILAGDDFYRTPAGAAATVVIKGRITGLTEAGGRVGYYSLFGGPVLARGGSGDLLAGMIATQLAQSPEDPTGAAARAITWHGLAADGLARSQGHVAVRTTQLLDFLPTVLRECAACPAS